MVRREEVLWGEGGGGDEGSDERRGRKWRGVYIGMGDQNRALLRGERGLFGGKNRSWWGRAPEGMGASHTLRVEAKEKAMNTGNKWTQTTEGTKERKEGWD